MPCETTRRRNGIPQTLMFVCFCSPPFHSTRGSNSNFAHSVEYCRTNAGLRTRYGGIPTPYNRLRMSAEEPERLEKPQRLEKPERPENIGQEAGTDEPGADVQGAYSLGDTLNKSPSLNSTLMNAMRDYFGDDGREVQDYTKRPRNEKGEPMFRVVLVGSGDRELLTAKKLRESGIVSGIYYCPDESGICDIRFTPYATSTSVSAAESEAEVVRFARWSLSDAVFVGPDQENALGKETEAALAESGITVFPHDVSAAIAEGTLTVHECLSSLAEDPSTQGAEQLVE